MIRKLILGMALFVPSLFFVSCSGETDGVGSISLIDANINGSDISSANQNVSTDAVINLTFSSGLDPSAFESKMSIQAGGKQVDFSVNYLNASSRAIITPLLEGGTSYSVSLEGGIGADGAVLSESINFSFKTQAANEVITATDPCTSASSQCLRSVSFSNGETSNSLEFYSNYPLYPENARWENLKYAVIVIHGINRNFDDYFSWAGFGVRAASLEENTILIAPQFKEANDASEGQFYYSRTGWRSGSNAQSELSLSSFAVIDSLVAQLGNKDIFPVMERIVITGHSSGALFTHVYAAANRAETNSIAMDYIVANSQYFYYPDGQRIDESTGQLITPSGCTGYTFWPYGYNNEPQYLSGVSETTVNDQFIKRSIYYFLGNGSGADGAFNDTDCEATLQGSSRYQRGENMHDYMTLRFTDNNHKKRIVEGVGHDGRGMYTSQEFSELLKEIL